MPEQARPNLVVVMSDQHNPRVLGCAGDPVIRTPHLDRLAAQGVRFAQTYAGSPLCVPSRATFLTGQSCSAVQVWSNSCTLASDIPTFMHALAIAGYDTVLSGRMHFKGPDQRHGFTERVMGDVSGPTDGHPHRTLGDIPYSSQGQSRNSLEIVGPGRTGFQAYDRDVTAAAVRFVRERAVQESDRPFCLVVGLVLPHSPYIAPRPLYDEYVDRVILPSVPAGARAAQHPAVRMWRQDKGFDEATPDQQRAALAGYYGMVTMVDEAVGQIVAALDETGLRERTAVFYTSDHGDMLGELGLWHKSTLYEGSVGVPLIASWPERFASGTTVDGPVSLIDLAPTFAALGGGPALPHTTGRVLTPLLEGHGPPAGWPPEVYAESMHVSGFPPSRMIRRGPWKLVRYHGYAAPVLFNLDDDPQELHDRAADPSCAAMRDELDALVRAGWSGAAVERSVARHQADRNVLDAWAAELHPAAPDLWQPPPGSNSFPE